MSKETERKLSAAQKRLKRIEEMVGPYAEDVTARPIRNRKQWVTGDHRSDSAVPDPSRDRQAAKVRLAG